MLLRSYGFTVLDLGVDVAPAKFVQEARTLKPHAIGMSGLITAAYPTIRETVIALRTMMAEDGVQIPILLGGQVDEQVCRFVGADYWSTDTMDGVRLCQRLVGADHSTLPVGAYRGQGLNRQGAKSAKTGSFFLALLAASPVPCSLFGPGSSGLG